MVTFPVQLLVTKQLLTASFPLRNRSKIIITSRKPLKINQIDSRVEFIALDFLNPKEIIVENIKEICKDVTHAFFASYIHDNDFSKLHVKNGPLFRNFLSAVDEACPRLTRVVLQTGGKVCTYSQDLFVLTAAYHF